ncbi:MAG: ABC transporter substrate-binding protein [Desulfamplus sp.]|nr:ABC transporter substrate-binding protein [Desulfamplus sp.]
MALQKLKFYSLSLVVICLFISVSTICAETFPQLEIMTEEWTPYNFEKDGVVQGISTDILVLMLEKVGSTQGRKDINLYPWARGYKLLKTKPNTLLYTTSKTEERENMFKWVGPIFEIDFNLYALKSRKIKINSFEEIKIYKIGTLRDDVVEEVLVKNAGMKVSDFDRVAANVFNMKKLAAGRVDLVPQAQDTTDVECKRLGLDPNDFEAVFLLHKTSMYYAFNKETPDSVIKTLQTAFDQLKNEGKLTEIFHSYGK